MEIVDFNVELKWRLDFFIWNILIFEIVLLKYIEFNDDFLSLFMSDFH